MAKGVSYEAHKALEARGDSDVVLGMEEAVRFLNAQPAGVTFMFGGSVQLPIVGQPDRVFPGYACLVISRAQAVDVVKNLLENLGRRGAQVRIRVRGAFVHI